MNNISLLKQMNNSLHMTNNVKSFIFRFLPDKCKQRVLRV